MIQYESNPFSSVTDSRLALASPAASLSLYCDAAAVSLSSPVEVAFTVDAGLSDALAILGFMAAGSVTQEQLIAAGNFTCCAFESGGAGYLSGNKVRVKQLTSTAIVCEADAFAFLTIVPLFGQGGSCTSGAPAASSDSSASEGPNMWTNLRSISWASLKKSAAFYFVVAYWGSVLLLNMAAGLADGRKSVRQKVRILYRETHLLSEQTSPPELDESAHITPDFSGSSLSLHKIPVRSGSIFSSPHRRESSITGN